MPVDPRGGAPSGGGGMRDVEAAVDMFLSSMEEGVLRVMVREPHTTLLEDSRNT